LKYIIDIFIEVDGYKYVYLNIGEIAKKLKNSYENDMQEYINLIEIDGFKFM
jgi:hypothetical protein